MPARLALTAICVSILALAVPAAARAADPVQATSDGSASMRVAMPAVGGELQLSSGAGALGVRLDAGALPIEASGGCHSIGEIVCDVPIGECSADHVCPAFGRVAVDGASGDDRLLVRGVTTRESLTISGLGGNDVIATDHTTGPLFVDGGEGSDHVGVNSADGPFQVRAGPGNDLIDVEDSPTGRIDCGDGADVVDPRPPAGVELDVASCPPFADRLYPVGASPGGGRPPKMRTLRVRRGRVQLTPFTVTEPVTGTLIATSFQFTGPRVRRFTRRATVSGGPGPVGATLRVPARLLAVPTPVLLELKAKDAGGDVVDIRTLVRLHR